MRTILDPENIHSNIKDEVANFQNEIVHEVSKTVAQNQMMVGGRYNPAVSKARDALKNVDGLANIANGICWPKIGWWK